MLPLCLIQRLWSAIRYGYMGLSSSEALQRLTKENHQLINELDGVRRKLTQAHRLARIPS